MIRHETTHKIVEKNNALISLIQMMSQNLDLTHQTNSMANSYMEGTVGATIK